MAMGKELVAMCLAQEAAHKARMKEDEEKKKKASEAKPKAAPAPAAAVAVAKPKPKPKPKPKVQAPPAKKARPVRGVHPAPIGDSPAAMAAAVPPDAVLRRREALQSAILQGMGESAESAQKAAADRTAALPGIMAIAKLQQKETEAKADAEKKLWRTLPLYDVHGDEKESFIGRNINDLPAADAWLN